MLDFVIGYLVLTCISMVAVSILLRNAPVMEEDWLPDRVDRKEIKTK